MDCFIKGTIIHCYIVMNSQKYEEIFTSKTQPQNSFTFIKMKHLTQFLFAQNKTLKFS